jgi:hypothetical protein
VGIPSEVVERGEGIGCGVVKLVERIDRGVVERGEGVGCGVVKRGFGLMLAVDK